MESDETRIFNAAHLMVASLAGSLAHVTCKVISITILSQFLILLGFGLLKNLLKCLLLFSCVNFGWWLLLGTLTGRTIKSTEEFATE